ncbi:MAG: glutathione S-transferase family protein [Gammaproteobacteria bacterium]|nr:glutathione S-transferase family protein [Gammaproteobacteria bacterium]
MLKLHGAPPSNYYNMVKIALLEKQLPFEEVMQPPTQDEPYLAKSPMGKIPTLETDRGFLTETHAILDYLEDAYPSPAFRPADTFARAKVRELTQATELYIELVALAEPDNRQIHAARAEIYQQRRGGETSLMAKGIFGFTAN